MAAFFDKLRECDINIEKIDPKVHHRLRIHFLTRIQGAAQPSEDPEVAMQVYEDAKLLLGRSHKDGGLASWLKIHFLTGTDTKIAIQADTGVSINGPIFKGKPMILSATDPNGRLLAVKILPTHETAFKSAAKAEEEAVKTLGLNELFDAYMRSEVKPDDSIPLIPTKYIEVRMLSL
jgi:hypothetical protein